MNMIVDVAILAVRGFLLLMVAQMLMSWFPSRGGNFGIMVRRVTDPVLGPIRSIIPPVRMGGIGLDLSFMVVYFGANYFLLPFLYSLR
jgi:YggT family protein